ncbi:hypothetical protein [Candidatus Viridilinea mediisalina]|uniref:Uncharacterized protein n=1 Tax=Candidatus Viridilinea mediisalina TaxID=2024553 RepID=A0A2A6RIR0_9CHLR|nr:hypothetical protein [Candidatus Viridilinea mediisalina]PDW02833.1 hypothetical protein CJ255_11845 [Candidatus Viridilinea mediisalina]
MIGVATSIFITPILALASSPLLGILTGISFGGLLAVLLISRDLTGQEIKPDERNQDGIMASLKNALLVSSIAGIMGTVAMGGVLTLIFAHTIGWIFGLCFGLGVALFSWSFYGGETFAKHLLLRAMFAKHSYLPWRLEDFFTACANIRLLARFGSGYTFMHMKLRDYMADVSDAEIDELVDRVKLQ